MRFNRAERLNVLFVVVVSQLAHILVVAPMVAAMIFLILGLILLSPELLAALDAQRIAATARCSA